MSSEVTVEDIIIHDEMTIYTVLSLQNDLSLHFQAGKGLQLNLSAVNEIDSAGIQLLMHLQKEAHLLSLPFFLNVTSDAVYEVFDLFNIRNNFEYLENSSEIGIEL